MTVGECELAPHELKLRCGVTAVVPCGAPLAAPYENPHDVPVVDGASRVTKPTWGRFPSVPSSGGRSRFGALFRLVARSGCTSRMLPLVEARTPLVSYVVLNSRVGVQERKEARNL